MRQWYLSVPRHDGNINSNQPIGVNLEALLNHSESLCLYGLSSLQSRQIMANTKRVFAQAHLALIWSGRYVYVRMNYYTYRPSGTKEGAGHVFYKHIVPTGLKRSGGSHFL